MAISITHAFVSAKADGADATLVRPSNWNAALVTSMATAKLLGRNTAGAGVFEEITLGTNLSFSGTTLNVPAMTATVGGAVPTPPNNTTTFLRGDGTFAAPTASVTWDTIGAAAGDGTTANGTNNIVYNTAPTADTKVAWTFGETSAATNGTVTAGVPNQVLLKLATLAASTQSPLAVYSRGTHVFNVAPATAQVLFKAGQGSTNIPIAVVSDNTTGIGLTAGEVDLYAGGTQALSQTASVTGIAAGSGSAPSLRSNAQYTTGLFFAASNVMGIGDSTAGEIARFTGGTNTRLFKMAGMLFANLGTPADGSFAYCSDCDPGTLFNSTCASSGTKTGSFARRVNGAWLCD